MSRIAIIGGAFDPPHAGHRLLADAVLRQWAGRALIVPCGTPVHKAACHGSPAARLAACRAMFPDAQVLDWEASGRLSGAAADLVQAVQERWPQAQLGLAIGTDQLNAFESWQRWREIAARAVLLVCPRGGVREDASAAARLQAAGARIVRLNAEPVTLSSSQIRRSVAGNARYVQACRCSLPA